MKRTALLGAKVAVSLALLAYLFSTTDLAALEERVRSADLLTCSRRRSAATWPCWRSPPGAGGSSSRPWASPPPCAGLTASYLVATFFNNFLPSNIGGDVVRVRDSSRLTGSTTASLAVVGDRPHPRLRRALRPRRGRLRRSAAPGVRDLAGARVVLLGLALLFGALAYVFFRPGHRARA